MIPKVVHYIWFGGKPFTEKAQKCFDSWKKHLPDYKFIRWDESNYNVDKYQFTKEAYQRKIYAFVSDVARLDIIYEYGGIYMDLDVEVLKNLDPFLTNEAFSGMQGDFCINPGSILGASAHNQIIGDMLKEYITKPFVIDERNNLLNNTAIPKVVTSILIQRGYLLNGKEQVIDGFHVYTEDFFTPDLKEIHKGNIPSNCYTIHDYAGSWVSNKYYERKSKWYWRIIIYISEYSAFFGRKILGEDKWQKFRNRFFKKLHSKIQRTTRE